MMVTFSVLSLGAGIASAQTAVCSETPGTGERVECTQDADSVDSISLTLKSIDIDTTDDEAPGVSGHHEGSNGIIIQLETDQDGNGDPFAMTSARWAKTPPAFMAVM